MIRLVTTESGSVSGQSAVNSSPLPFGPQLPPLEITEPGKCNHRTSSGGYSVVRHTFSTEGNPIWLRCLRCGKNWKDVSEDLSHAVGVQTDYDAAAEKVQAMKDVTSHMAMKFSDTTVSAFKSEDIEVCGTGAVSAPRAQVADVFVQTVTDRMIKEDA
jgi:hypothetical protein